MKVLSGLFPACLSVCPGSACCLCCPLTLCKPFFEPRKLRDSRTHDNRTLVLQATPFAEREVTLPFSAKGVACETTLRQVRKTNYTKSEYEYG